MVMEALPEYSEDQRDRLERQLAIEANKREINARRNGAYVVRAFWHRETDTCSIFVRDESVKGASEFVVPNDEVGEWFIHPFAHPDNTIPRHEQRSDSE